uniref:Gametogenetin binding protein 1 n=1 Tax=Nannospalax galili TaxID=1026970 RepID=A0A8C6Q968_NANGA
METRAWTLLSRSRILGCSSMFHFLRSLVGGKSSSKRSDKALAWSRPSSSQEHDAVSPRMVRRGGRRRREPQLCTMVPTVFSVASSNLWVHDALGLGVRDIGCQTLTPNEALKLRAQGREVVTSVPTRGSREVLGHLFKKEKKEEEEERAGEASGASGASDRDHLAQALEVEQGCLQWVPGPLALSAGAFIKEEEGHCLIEIGDLRITSCKVGSTPWNYLLGLYKQLQKSVIAKGSSSASPFPLKDALPREEREEKEEMEGEDSSLKLCAPQVATFQSPLYKSFRSTDTVGFMESELKKILSVQRESRLWKVGSLEGRELLTQPEIMPHLLLEEMDEMGNWPRE